MVRNGSRSVFRTGYIPLATDSPPGSSYTYSPSPVKMASTRDSNAHTSIKRSRQIHLCRVLPDSEIFPDNRVITAKYTVKSFVPKFLFSVFSQYANLFFLCVALLQQIPRASPTGQWTTVIPLTTIIIISAIKDIYEDFVCVTINLGVLEYIFSVALHVLVSRLFHLYTTCIHHISTLHLYTTLYPQHLYSQGFS